MDFAVSIITPTLNAASFIEKCIDSVDSQLGVHVQHIIVDGGSTDGTIESVKRRSVTVLSLPGSSIYEAINYGISHAQGPLLGFLNADDAYTSETALARIVEAFSVSGNKGIVYGNCLFVDAQGKTRYRLNTPRQISSTFARLRVFNISHPSWYIDAHTMKAMGGYDTKLRFVSDCDLIIRAIERGVRFTHINFDVARFTLHSSNASRSVAANIEFKHYFEHINGSSAIQYCFHLILIILQYARDPRYFFYRCSRPIKTWLEHHRSRG